MVAATLLAVAAFVGLALILAGRLAALACLAAANALFVVLLLLSGMVFPLDELPSGLRSMAQALPSTALADALRGALAQGVEIPSARVAGARRVGHRRGRAGRGALPLGAERLTNRAAVPGVVGRE